MKKLTGLLIELFPALAIVCILSSFAVENIIIAQLLAGSSIVCSLLSIKFIKP